MAQSRGGCLRRRLSQLWRRAFTTYTEVLMADESIGAPHRPPRLHHVVFAVAAETFEPASQYLSELGFRLTEFVLDDVKLRVGIDWVGGVELVTPSGGHVIEPGSVGDFLARHGEGVFSVVVRVQQADEASRTAQAAGAADRYRQKRCGTGFSLTEIEMTPWFGMPMTFLETDPELP